MTTLAARGNGQKVESGIHKSVKRGHASLESNQPFEAATSQVDTTWRI